MIFDGIMALAANITSRPKSHSVTRCAKPREEDVKEFTAKVMAHYPMEDGETWEQYQTRLAFLPFFSQGGPFYKPAILK